MGLFFQAILLVSLNQYLNDDEPSSGELPQVAAAQQRSQGGHTTLGSTAGTPGFCAIVVSPRATASSGSGPRRPACAAVGGQDNKATRCRWGLVVVIALV